jgi:hypothetical protein
LHKWVERNSKLAAPERWGKALFIEVLHEGVKRCAARTKLLDWHVVGLIGSKDCWGSQKM